MRVTLSKTRAEIDQARTEAEAAVQLWQKVNESMILGFRYKECLIDMLVLQRLEGDNTGYSTMIEKIQVSPTLGKDLQEASRIFCGRYGPEGYNAKP